MPVFTKNGKSVLYIHIPKTGGSTLEGHLARLGWRETFSVRGIRADDLAHFRATPQHFHAELLAQIFDFSKFDAIGALVRDPFARLRSEFYWHFRNTQNPPTPKDWVDQTFVDFQADPFLHDNHIRPQVDFLPKDVPVSVFKLEENGILKAQNALTGHAALPKKTLKEWLRGRRGAKASKYRDDLDAAFEEIRPKIIAFYEADYAKFGYSPSP